MERLGFENRNVACFSDFLTSVTGSGRDETGIRKLDAIGTNDALLTH